MVGLRGRTCLAPRCPCVLTLEALSNCPASERAQLPPTLPKLLRDATQLKYALQAIDDTIPALAVTRRDPLGAAPTGSRLPPGALGSSPSSVTIFVLCMPSATPPPAATSS